MSSLLYFFRKYFGIQPEPNFNRYKDPLKSKVPLATEYIKKIEDKGNIGKKRKAARC